MRFQTLEEWLEWQESLHPSEIELGLERIRSVFARLHPEPPPFITITVAGTNGKGSSVALLESILLAAGYRVGCYTSPHLLRYNERVRLDGEPVADVQLCQAFERVDQARGETSLTYFEFGTLAALDIFYRQPPDVVVLEVGMGGRLDAVNILDADVALITSIDIDHSDWLGGDRESIGREKAGIMRPGRWAVCNDPHPPQSLLDTAEQRGTRLLRLGHDYHYQVVPPGWSWQGGESGRRDGLPQPALRGEMQLQNAAGVLMALQLLAAQLPISQAQVREGLHAVRLPGRFQVIPGAVTTIVDVAHNAEAGRALVRNLRQHPCTGRTLAVFAALRDKDLEQLLGPFCEVIEAWYLAPLQGPRAATVEQMQGALQHACGETQTQVFRDIESAYGAALGTSGAGDRIVVFGSFFTVASVLPLAV